MMELTDIIWMIVIAALVALVCAIIIDDARDRAVLRDECEQSCALAGYGADIVEDACVCLIDGRQVVECSP